MIAAIAEERRRALAEASRACDELTQLPPGSRERTDARAAVWASLQTYDTLCAIEREGTAHA